MNERNQQESARTASPGNGNRPPETDPVHGSAAEDGQEALAFLNRHWIVDAAPDELVVTSSASRWRRWTREWVRHRVVGALGPYLRRERQYLEHLVRRLNALPEQGSVPTESKVAELFEAADEAPAPADAEPAAWFDEPRYLELNPDVADAVERREIPSGLWHFIEHGLLEGRRPPTQESGDDAAALPGALAPTTSGTTHHVDHLDRSPCGDALISGWVIDDADPMVSISVRSGTAVGSIPAQDILRFRRRDLEGLPGARSDQPHGFLTFVDSLDGVAEHGTVEVLLGFASGTTRSQWVRQNVVRDHDMLQGALRMLTWVEWFGDEEVESFAALDGTFGRLVVQRHCDLAEALVRSSHSERFGQERTPPRASIIVSMTDRPDRMAVQSAMFSRCAQIDAFEFIYVCDDPSVFAVLRREAQMAHRIYGIASTIVALADQAGRATAHNAGAAHAKSDQLMFVAPDVVPTDPGWAAAILNAIEAAPPETTVVFGAPVVHGDEAMVEEGVRCVPERRVSFHNGEIRERTAVRVESDQRLARSHTSTRAPWAVEGLPQAFLSIERRFFDGLGGFSARYPSGIHAEVDLCLASHRQGVRPHMHDLPLLRLEPERRFDAGSPSGASLVGAWQLSCRWQESPANARNVARARWKEPDPGRRGENGRQAKA